MSEELIRDEGLKYSAYPDQFGYLTIGVGFLIDARRNGQIPKPVVDFWLNYLIQQCLSDIQSESWFEVCSPSQQRGLLNMRYQLGSVGIREFKTSLGLLSQGKFQEAGINLRESLWYKETPERAERVIKLIEGNI